MFITAMGSESKKAGLFKRGFAIVLMSIIFFTSAFSVAALSKTAIISVDGQELKFTIVNSDVDDVLEMAGVNVGKNDKVTSSDKNGVLSITVTRAFSVVLNNNGTKTTYQFVDGTVADVLKKANVKLSEKIEVDPDKDTVLKENMVITVSNFKTISLTDNGKTKEAKVPQGTVENALSYLKIKLGKDDIVSVDLKDDVTDNMKIEVTRVTYKDVKTKEAVDFETITEESDELDPGEEKTVTKGVKGEKTITTRETLYNGKVVDREITEEKVTKKPVDEKILVGAENDEAEVVSAKSGSTKNGVLYDESGNEVSYSRVLTGSGTAYYAPQGSLTATGTEVYVGGVAVNPDIIPYGTKMYIESVDGFVYGYATAIDTGGALMDGSAIVDVFYFTYDECEEFGRRDVNVYILD